MAQKAYIGIGGVARNVKSIYFGVGNTARKVTKGYIGVGGVARPFFSQGPIVFYGAITPLSQARTPDAASSNYALFAGGASGGAVVDAYNSSLTRSNPTQLSYPRTFMGSAVNNGYAIFAGGWLSTSARTNRVETYNASLTRSTASSLSIYVTDIEGANIGNYAIFGGGSVESSEVVRTKVVNTYNKSLTRSTATSLSIARSEHCACSTSSHAIFAGGRTSSYSGSQVDTVDAYTSSLTRVSVTPLSHARLSAGGASCATHAFFAGGSDSNRCDALDVYNTSLTRMTGQLPVAASGISATFLGDYVVMSFGYDRGTIPYGAKGNVYVYDKSMTLMSHFEVDEYRNNVVAKIGNFALFAGGSIHYPSGATATVQAFMLNE